MTKKDKPHFTPEPGLEYAKLMLEEGYTNKQVQDISGAGASAVARWKAQYKQELAGKTPFNKTPFNKTPFNKTPMTPEQQRIQYLEKQHWRAHRDNDILKKAAAFFIRDNRSLKPFTETVH